MREHITRKGASRRASSPAGMICESRKSHDAARNAVSGFGCNCNPQIETDWQSLRWSWYELWFAADPKAFPFQRDREWHVAGRGRFHSRRKCAGIIHQGGLRRFLGCDGALCAARCRHKFPLAISSCRFEFRRAGRRQFSGENSWADWRARQEWPEGIAANDFSCLGRFGQQVRPARENREHKSRQTLRLSPLRPKRKS